MGKIVVAVVIIAAAIAGVVIYERDYRVPTNVAYVTEENGKIDMIDLATMKVVRSVKPNDVAPRGIGVTYDGKYVITADKDTADIAIFSTPRLKLVARTHTGDNPEFIKLNPAGTRVYSTFEPSSTGGPPPANGAADDDNDANEPPAQIATVEVGSWKPGPVSTAGQETEGMEFSPDGKYLIVCNEAQNNLGIFDAATGAHVRDIDLKSYGLRPRDIKISPQHNFYAVTMEASGTLAKLDLNFNVLKAVPTAAKPYGESFDRAGKRIFVAAATARKLQVFDAGSLNLIAEVPIGQRCWHFTFTPDDSKILLACGRSNAIDIVDPNSYKEIGQIGGFNLPWGIVTYPRAYGSLGLP
ncbi:MAG: beta-propeller fold lactonase family protein [Candidatus Acidiferrales bacterium]